MSIRAALSCRSAALIALVLVLLAGCETSSTGRRQLILMDDATLEKQATALYSEMQQKMPISTHEAKRNYVLCVSNAITSALPSDAPALKIANTKAYGTEVRTYDRYHQDRETIGAELARVTGASLVRPYDDAWVIAGQGTVGLEITEQCRALGITPDAVLSPAGGGGLIAGASLAFGADLPATKLYACEPEGFDDHRKSLASGDRTANEEGQTSFCDALLAAIPGKLTFAINRDRLAGGFAVSDAEVASAMAIAFTDLKIVVEPGGAVALAAALAGRIKTRDRTIVVVTSGGNVDPAVFNQALRSAA
jgi:threonine dehydratase